MNRFILIGLLITLFSCEDEYQEPFLVDDELYFPVFSSKIYLVEEIQYEISGFDTLQYFLRERITDTLSSGSSSIYVITRERQTLDGVDWEVDSVWSFRTTDRQVILRQNGVDQVKLTFPVQVEKSWDVNAFNTRSPNTVFYKSVAEAIVQLENDTIATELAEVSITDLPPSIVGQNQQTELYGKGLGLVQKNSIILEFCTVDCDSARQINTGRFLSQKLLRYE